MTTALEADASDLDLLDDPCKHARCQVCQCKHARCQVCQDLPPGVPFIALCGRRAVGLTGLVVRTEDLPPGVKLCLDCLWLIDKPCRRCPQ